MYKNKISLNPQTPVLVCGFLLYVGSRPQHQYYPTLFEKCVGSLKSPDRMPRDLTKINVFSGERSFNRIITVGVVVVQRQVGVPKLNQI